MKVDPWRSADPSRLSRGAHVAAESLRRRLPVDADLLRSSGIVLAGNATARLLGFLFYVMAARLLDPADYGQLAYALAILVAASILLTNSPSGLQRFLSRHAGDRQEQDAYFSNWVAVIAAMLGVSVLACIPLSPLIRLDGWLLAGLLLNLGNIAVFETYMEAQRGLSRFRNMAVFYSLANFVQLAAILFVAALGYRSAALFLFLYGFSGIAALAAMELMWPTPLSFRQAALTRRRMLAIARYVLPIIAQGVFFSFWWGADVILTQHLLPSTATGNYAAGKTLAQTLILAPTALQLAVSPRIARLSEAAIRRYLPRLLALAAAAVVPVAAFMVLLQRPLVFIFYGTKYPHALDAFDPVVLGVSLYGLYLILASTWGALGRPQVGAAATGLGTVVTLALAFALIPRLGLLGAGVGFAAGAASQLLAVSTFTVWGLYSGKTARVGHLSDL